MNQKKHLQSRIQGWLPKEYVASPPQNPAEKYPAMIRWTARAIVAGAGVSATLLVFGDIAGLTHGIGSYLWYATVEGSVWGVVATVPFLVKRKEEHQRRKQT
ncbi:MAG: hypothetical protein ACBZ72_13315 [Candidatus Bathyarchaeia archaeon]|jgi:integral membrane sensor domain MASE1